MDDPMGREPVHEEDGLDSSRMPFVEHLRELRNRLAKSLLAVFIATIGAFTFREEIFAWLCSPLQRLPTERMQVLGLVEMFVTYLKLSVLFAVFFASPFWLYQAWRFAAPGLYGHEKRWIVPFILLGSLFFVGGGAFAFYVVLPLGFDYLVQMVPEAIEANYRVADYVSLVTRLLLAFGLVFELPLVMWVLAAARIVSPHVFAKLRKYWLVIAVMIGAFLTPPDPMTQLLMAVPLVIFFEVGMIGAHLLYRKRGEKPANAGV